MAINETGTESEQERESAMALFTPRFFLSEYGYVSLRYTDSQLELREESG